MSAEKLVTIFGAAGSIEASYDAGGAPSLTDDAILLAEPATLQTDYALDGARGQAPAGMGRIKKAAPGGRMGSITLPIDGRGLGAAYGAAAFPPDVHKLLRMAGHVATLDATVSAEKWTYTPESWDGAVPPGFASGVFRFFGRGQEYGLQGAYATVGFTVENGGFLRWSFALQGKQPNAPVDIALPAITYANTEPPKAEDFALSLASDTGTAFTSDRIRSIAFNGARAISARNTYGFSPGLREPTLELVMETPKLATVSPWHTATELHPWRLWELATPLAVSFQVGTVQYNRMKFAAAAAQIENVVESEDGATSLMTVTMRLSQSDPVTPDDYEITFD